MTIKVTITNADVGETRIIEVRNVAHDLSALDLDPRTDYANRRQLKGGESADFYVHSAQSIVVREVQNG